MGGLFSEPWRTIDKGTKAWSEEQRCGLRQAITRMSFPNSKGVRTGNIVFFGPVKSGKSSFINSLKAIEKGRIAQQVPTGNAEYSLTPKFTQYTFDNFHVSDTMGLQEMYGLDIDDVKYILRGNMPKGYKFDQKESFTEKSSYYNKSPTNADMIHCIVFCIGADTILSEMPRPLLRKCRLLLKAAWDEGTPRIVVLTKIDTICKRVNEDVTNTFHSKAVAEAVKLASELLSIEQMYIHPVQNLTETMPTRESCILHLNALKHAAAFSQDFIQMLKDDK